MTAAQRTKLKRLVQIHAQACIQHSWKGNMEPEEARETEKKLKQARRNLYSFINSL